MIKTISIYIATFGLVGLIGIFIMDYIVLPLVVGINTELYIPDVRGKYFENAKGDLTDLGLKIDKTIISYNKNYKSGTVISMNPRPFTKVKQGKIISLSIAGSKNIILVPNIIGNSYRNARIILEENNLELDTILYELNNNVGIDSIIFQYPRAGEIVETGKKISLGVSQGKIPDFYIVPSLLNLDLAQAKQIIRKNGLQIGDISYKLNTNLLLNTVIEQNFTPGQKLSFPAKINLVISK
jgi:serine/threonine-protein kinase